MLPANIRPRRAPLETRITMSSAFGSIRHDWTLSEVEALFALPFMDLLFHAQRVHRENHAPNTVQTSTLLSIKTGACPEDCAYCPQSVRYDTGLEREVAGCSPGPSGHVNQGVDNESTIGQFLIKCTASATPTATAPSTAISTAAAAQSFTTRMLGWTSGWR